MCDGGHVCRLSQGRGWGVTFVTVALVTCVGCHMLGGGVSFVYDIGHISFRGL